MTINVNFRRCPVMHEVYAVLGKFKDAKYLCYCINDDMYFDSDADFLKRRTNVVKQGITDLLDIVKKRYADEILNVVYNLKYVTKL